MSTSLWGNDSDITHSLTCYGLYNNTPQSLDYQDKMTPDQIRELKIKIFTYLSSDDIHFSMSDRNIVRKELDLSTYTVLPDSDKHSIRDFYYSMRECLSTHDNPNVQNKSYVSLKPVNLKPFYMKRYLTHESEIKFAEAEMEKLRHMFFCVQVLVNFVLPSYSSQSHIVVHHMVHPHISSIS